MISSHRRRGYEFQMDTCHMHKRKRDLYCSCFPCRGGRADVVGTQR